MLDIIGEALSGLDDVLSLKRPLAADSPADKEDVLAVKKDLRRSGYYDEPDYGLTPYPDKPLFDGIRAFQKDNKLTVDGVMKPGGETETALNRHRIAQADPLQARAQDENIVRQFIRAKNEERTQSSPSESALPPVPPRKPEAIAPTPKGNELLDLIGKLESSDNYNIVYGNEEKPLTKMTIKEIQKLQQKMYDSGKVSTAVGRYQIIYDKMNDLIKWMDIDENQMFDEAFQDKMGRELIKRRGFEKFKAGKISANDFIRQLSQEWAALPKDESNESYYKGVGSNKALIDFETLKDILEKR